MPGEFNRDKEHKNVGTVGHVDHGKTTLTAAITKALSKKDQGKFIAYDSIDKAPEERDRGITISSATVEYSTDKYHYAHTDCPGHQDYIKNMITGASNLDGAILVVAVTDGPMPQTIEHILMLKQLGVKNIVVFLNKIDQVQEEEREEMIELVKMEVMEILTKFGYDASKVEFVVGSALLAMEGDEEMLKPIYQLLDILDEFPAPKRLVDKPFRMPVESVLSIKGIGTVATGTITQGKIKVNDKVEIIGIGKQALSSTVIGIEMFKKKLPEGWAGDNAGIALRGIGKDEICRGMVISDPGSIKPYKKFTAEVYILTEKEGGKRISNLKVGFSPQFHFNTADVTGTFKKILETKGSEKVEKAFCMPGDHVTLEIELLKPLAMDKNSRFTTREGNKTIAYGKVVEVAE